MKYKIIISESAFKDLEGIKHYISVDNPSAANTYLKSVFERIESLESFPFRGVSIANPVFAYAKAHYLVCLNHIAIYQINELAKCIYILRVLSHFQNWKNIVNKELLNNHKLIISDDVLSIERMNRSMYYDVYRNSLDEDNRKYVPDEVFETLEEASEVVDSIIQSYENKDGPFVYAVIRKEDSANIGYVQLVKIEEGWEIGYHIAKIYTKRGYATNAVNLFLKYLRSNMDLKEVYGVALATNKASRRVLEKCGFELFFEGEGMYQGKRRKIVKTIKSLK